MKKILEYAKPFRLFLLVTLLIKTFATVLDLLIPYLLGMILDEVAPRCLDGNLTPIFFWGGVMLLCAGVILFLNVYANRRSSHFCKCVVRDLRKDLYDRILALSSAQTDRFTIPSLVSRLSSDSYTIHGMLVTLLRGGIRCPILFVGGVCITLITEPVLALSLLVTLPLLVIIVTTISKKGIRLYKEKQTKVDAMVEKVRDTFTGIRVIKALSKTQHEKESFEAISDELSFSEEKAGMTMAISKPVVSLFLNLGMTAVVLIGAWRVSTGATAPGQIISFMSYFTMILNATIGLTRIFTVSSKGAASADRIREVLEEKEDLTVQKMPYCPSDAYIEFRDVSFSYNKSIPTLSHVSFSLQKGQTLGIIGSTGSGKTTLIQLLLRFYDPDEGQILLDGKDLRSYPKKELRKKFGVVFQHDFLFADRICENIRFNRDLDEDAVREAARDAQAIDFIETKEGGFDHTLTSKGANLSGGQRQRVLISRALAGHADVLILDDASSALDYKTDAELRSALQKNHADSTRVIVAQRISSIRNADLILVLENGEIVGMGSDSTLNESCDVYREIAHSQMGEMAV